jgi:hypothetical protein
LKPTRRCALARNKPTDPEQVYAYALYLSGNNQESAALAHLNTLSRDKWNSNIQELSDRLEANQRWRGLISCAIRAMNQRRSLFFNSSLRRRVLI